MQTARHETYRCEFVNCGKCKGGCAHGPYWYAYWKENGRLRKRYIGKLDPRPDAQNRAVPAVLPDDVYEAILKEETASYPVACAVLNLEPGAFNEYHARERWIQLRKAYRMPSPENARMRMAINAAWGFLRTWHGWK
jgi:hypothetical protein